MNCGDKQTRIKGLRNIEASRYWYQPWVWRGMAMRSVALAEGREEAGYEYKDMKRAVS